ncbi:diphthine--ammonia ligase [Gramella sp. KN1008]|uniref:Dph6-related ATP pyrophosphatase n=1 Tax=Gramella sp. KN1008 TaxID=2529298 RepID=UPI00103A3B94|nr:diphthine--ammonia ligase [Gramella sp. KN1008]TBW25765.1 diphthine--ammonia ligase [Gramella sp. KN1008]
MKKAWLNWSSGKDSAMALYHVQNGNEYSVEMLFTTLSDAKERVSMHGLRKDLLLAQVESIGLSLQITHRSTGTSLNTYNKLMENACMKFKNEGFTHSIFGDIFLEDLREYREKQLDSIGVKTVFPLWKKDTSQLMQEFIELGFKAIVVCTNSKYLENSFCGRVIDDEFLKDLPANVDPCGENGEFHTFVFDGPIFTNPVNFKIGEKHIRTYDSEADKWDNRFCYCDLLPE